MGWRASPAVVLSLALVACGSHTGTSGPQDDGDASAPLDLDAHSDVSFPSPDAIVLVDDSGASDDASQDTGVVPGSCVGKADGTVCVASPDGCHTDATCKQGLCGGLGTRADGYNWQAGDDTARCCVGKPIHANTNGDCGACGIQCNAGNGESCQALGAHWFCRGCIASAACWSKCCSLSFTPSSCAASDCVGNCSAQYCPAGSHCVVGAPNSSDYCSY